MKTSESLIPIYSMFECKENILVSIEKYGIIIDFDKNKKIGDVFTSLKENIDTNKKIEEENNLINFLRGGK